MRPPRPLALLRALGPAAAALLLGAAARGAPPVNDNARRADALFQEAQALLDRGKTREACGLFAESEALDPAIGTLLNLANCHTDEGKLATARGELDEAARMAAERKPRDRKREDFARAKIAELDKQMPYVRLEIAPSSGVASVALDGQPLEKSAWESPIPLDPGEHRFELGGPGKQSRTIPVTVPRHPGTQPVTVADLDDVPGAIAPTTSDDPARGRRIAGFVVTGLGAAGLTVGAVFGVRAIGKKGDASAHCEGKFCDAEGLGLDHDAHTAATASTIAFGIGLAAAAAGVTLILTARRPSAPKSALSLTPAVGPRGGGLRLDASF